MPERTKLPLASLLPIAAILVLSASCRPTGDEPDSADESPAQHLSSPASEETPASPEPTEAHSPLDRIEWVRIEAGEFVRGTDPAVEGAQPDEAPQRVTISRPFLIMATEVTEAHWEALMGSVPVMSFPGPECPGQPNCPLDRVNWWDALAFANALSAHEGLEPCYHLDDCQSHPGRFRLGYACKGTRFVDRCLGYRLPTEAEWEYVARAGSRTRYPCGDDSACVLDQAVLGGGFAGPLPVASRAPNAWGVYDMLGNVNEWVWDYYAPYPSEPERDPRGPETSSDGQRVLRGGFHASDLSGVRPAARLPWQPGWHFPGQGFRLVRTLGE